MSAKLSSVLGLVRVLTAKPENFKKHYALEIHMFLKILPHCPRGV
jgi:hypothetical protein